MAALTQSAIDALLGALTTVIQDEVRLIGGVHRDMKFIKDEMDSMNGFLMHLNKMESEHDDQIRAWMKQVREVSYVAEDCVDRYRRVATRHYCNPGDGCLCTLAFILVHPKAYWQLSKLGKQIAELKTRVQEVGARRERYDVKVPTDDVLKVEQTKLPDQVEKEREAFVHALLEKDDVGTPAWFRSTAAPPTTVPTTETPTATAKTPAAPATTETPTATAKTPAAPPTTPTTVSTPVRVPAAPPTTPTTETPTTPADTLLDALLLEDARVGQLPAGSTVRSEAGIMLMRAILKKCCPPLPPAPGGGAAGDAATTQDKAAAKADKAAAAAAAATAADVDPDEAAATATAKSDKAAAAKAKATATAADVDPDEAVAFRCTRNMFLCAMYVYPYLTTEELKKLKEGVTAVGVGRQEARRKVMVFCYSLLTTQQKSCLQYVTAFLYEKEISRTSMVRRWVAEGLVGKEPAGGGSSTATTTPEEAGELCFRELLLRGFVRAARRSDAGTVKSCVMDAPIRAFLKSITKSENFIAELPAHLDRQLQIRSIVQRRASSSSMAPPPMPLVRRRCNLCCCTCTWLLDDHRASEDAKDPMDELVDFIRELPELYRLNVLDLGGCTGLRSRHLKSFAKEVCLKYLSLRNTDVHRLDTTHINKLTLLETLDIRDTNIPPRHTARLYLPRLKHLLAGRFITATTAVDKAALVTVRMPHRIGSMKDMETLSHVEVSMDGAELQGVAKLHQLRKLGVLVHANTSTAALLGRVLYMLAANLRSLSIWVAIAVPHTTTTTITTQTQQQQSSGILDISSMYEMPSSNLALENLDIKGKMSLPSWIGRASKLANVTLRDTEMDGGDALRRLSTVQSLRCLKLSRKAFSEQALRFKDVQFQALKFLVVQGDAVTRIAFLAGDAAPKLEKIVWVIGGGSKIAQMYNEDLIIGIECLPGLKEIELRASFNLAILLEWTKKQQATHPRYHIRYISSSAGNQLITEVPRTDDHTTLALPAGVIN